MKQLESFKILIYSMYIIYSKSKTVSFKTLLSTYSKLKSLREFAKHRLTNSDKATYYVVDFNIYNK